MPVPPAYGRGALADLSPAVGAALGVDGCVDVLGLPAADRVCVVLLDGLGDPLLRAHAASAPFLGGLAAGARTLDAGFPSTTATSLGSVGTGLPPGGHGLLGYRVAVPGTGAILNHLSWDAQVDPCAWQPHATLFERAVRHGVAVSHVARGAFDGSGFTRAALRGPRYVPADDVDALVAGTAAAVRAAPRTWTFTYFSGIDRAGHEAGCDSPAWRRALAEADRLVARIAAACPPGTLLLVTADHGMVDVPADARVDLDGPAGGVLRAGVALVAGEARARYLYTVPGAVPDVLATWRGVLGPRAWVVAREEAVAAGWFGPVAPGVAARIGDVVVAAAGPDLAVVETVTEASESRLVGYHGSLTPTELRVPLLLAAGPGR